MQLDKLIKIYDKLILEINLNVVVLGCSQVDDRFTES